MLLLEFLITWTRSWSCGFSWFRWLWTQMRGWLLRCEENQSMGSSKGCEREEQDR